MRLTISTLMFGAALVVAGPAAAQETVPPLQPPYPTAPPPQKWPMAVRAFGFGYDAARQTEDAVAALTVRGFFPIAAPDVLFALTEPALDCLRLDRQDHACVQTAVSGIVHDRYDPVPLVFVEGRLEGDVLSWTCIGAARIVTIDFVLGDFFTPDMGARQESRNRALACIERALGFDRTQMHTDL